MFKRIAIAGVLICLSIGCGKKTVKLTGSSDDSPSTPNPQTAVVDKDKLTGKDKPNPSKDSSFDRDGQAVLPNGNQTGVLPGKPSGGIPKPEGGLETPNSQPGIANPGGAPGSPMKPPVPLGPVVAPSNTGVSPPTVTVITTVAKPVLEADMKDVWIYIENRSGASGQMPALQEIYAALIAAKSPAADLARGGSIVLTGSRARESIWAYEAKATTQGGLVATQNGVERLTAAELNRRLAGR